MKQPNEIPHPADLAEWVARSRAEQGLPQRIEDDRTLANLRSLLAVTSTGKRAA